MVVALTKGAILSRDETDLNLSIKLGITASDAKRKVSHYFMDEISLLIGPEEPTLVILSRDDVVWRFPIMLTMGGQGSLGEVGQVDVDARTGGFSPSAKQIAEIVENARALALGASYSTVD